jgi:hypothetical protein
VSKWVIVWETDDGPSVTGIFENQEAALDAAFDEWCSFWGGIAGGYDEGAREEFDAMYKESSKVWVVPC